VTFEASDGVTLVGRIFGEGDAGVVLAHMGRAGDTQADWYRLARALAARGYTALTYNRRGVCNARARECSGGSDDYASSWQDVVGAVDFLRERGAREVILIGASIGAMASLHALVTGSVDAAAFVEIAGVNDRSGYAFSREQLERSREPSSSSRRPMTRTPPRTLLAHGTAGRSSRRSWRSFPGPPTEPTCSSRVNPQRDRSWSSSQLS
jgi:pimeloyl-ACP methyl ester carboxylesterase